MTLSGPILKKCLETFFDENAELDARVKTGVLDKIHRAVFKSTLEDEFSKKEINAAIDEKWIISKYVHNPRTGANQKVYIWLLFRSPQHGKLKRGIEKVVKTLKKSSLNIFN